MSQRTLVVLEPPIRDIVKHMARANGVSISSLCRDLIKEALEIFEDKYWDKVAQSREKSFNWSEALTHEQVWSKKRDRGKG